MSTEVIPAAVPVKNISSASNNSSGVIFFISICLIILLSSLLILFAKVIIVFLVIPYKILPRSGVFKIPFLKQNILLVLASSIYCPALSK